jgi:hypothetical protein
VLERLVGEVHGHAAAHDVEEGEQSVRHRREQARERARPAQRGRAARGPRLLANALGKLLERQSV